MKKFNFSSIKAVKANRHLIFNPHEPRHFFTTLYLLLSFMRAAIKGVFNLIAWSITVILFGCMVVIDFLSDYFEARSIK